MDNHLDTGRAGEDAAAEYLCDTGYELRERNWRSGPYELDIIAQRDGVLHFVEVKTRRAGALTPPEAAITPHKFRSLSHAATHYLSQHHWLGEVQFDLAAVDALPEGGMQVRFIENAMEHNW